MPRGWNHPNMAIRWIRGAIVASALLSTGAAWSQIFPERVPGRIIVKFKAGYERLAPQAHRFAGAAPLGRVSATGAQTLRFSDDRAVWQAVNFYRSLPGVAYAEPDYILRANGEPTDPDWLEQYGWRRTKLALAWDVTHGSADFPIAIVDTGVDTSHEDLADKILPGYDFVNGDDDPQDDHGHGTHCAGIAAAGADNGFGGVGIGYAAKIMPVKVLDAAGGGSTSGVAQGIVYAVDHGAKVISLSLGGPVASEALRDAINYATSHQVVVVAAAGNDGTSSPSYPAAFDGVLAVAASDEQDRRASYSNYGTWVQVAAPGDHIYSTLPGNHYGYMSGTSMAAPAVAGLANLVWSKLGGSATSAQVRERIVKTAEKVGGWVRYGRIDALKAVKPDAGIGATFTLNRTTTFPSRTLQGRLLLNQAAPVGGVTFNLVSSSNNVNLPASVKILEGRREKTFLFYVKENAAGETITLTAQNGDTSLDQTLVVEGPQLLSARFLQSDVAAGGDIRFMVVLNSAAPVGGMQVQLTSSLPNALPVPANLTVARGRREAIVRLRAGTVDTESAVEISASLNGTTKSGTTTIKLPSLVSLESVRPSVGPNGEVALIITSQTVAPDGGFTVHLETDRPDLLAVPATITIPSLRRSVRIAFKAGAIAEAGSATIQARLGNSKKTVTIELKSG